MLTLLGYDQPPEITGEPDTNFPTTNMVGVEIELECVPESADTFFSDYNSRWSITGDGSLKKAGLEFIFKNPFAGNAITEALDQMRTYLGTTSGSKCEANDRCSVHVHVDIRDITPKEVYKFLLLYVLFERQLYEVAGRSRAKNNNCVPVGESDTFMQAVNVFKNVRTSLDRVHEAVKRCGKYVGCNVESITYGYRNGGMPRGSVEFRMHRGTKDMDEVRYWITLLLRMKEFARSEFNPENISQQFSLIGPNRFTEKVFGDLAPLLSEQNSFTEDLYDGVRNVECICQYDCLEGFATEFTKPPVGPPKPNRDLIIEDLLNQARRPKPLNLRLRANHEPGGFFPIIDDQLPDEVPEEDEYEEDNDFDV